MNDPIYSKTGNKVRYHKGHGYIETKKKPISRCTSSGYPAQLHPLSVTVTMAKMTTANALNSRFLTPFQKPMRSS